MTKVLVRFNDLIALGRYEAWLPETSIFIGIGETPEQAVHNLYVQTVAWCRQQRRGGVVLNSKDSADIEWELVDFKFPEDLVPLLEEKWMFKITPDESIVVRGTYRAPKSVSL